MNPHRLRMILPEIPKAQIITPKLQAYPGGLILGCLSFQLINSLPSRIGMVNL